MSKIGSTDGLSILARYTSVVAIAVASAGSLPKNVFEDVPRNDQIAIEQKDDQGENGAEKA
jgi:hypothetical protein